MRKRLAVEDDLAARALVEPADALDDLASAGADQAGDAEDLALVEREGDVAEAAAVGEAAHLHQRVRAAAPPRSASAGRACR